VADYREERVHSRTESPSPSARVPNKIDAGQNARRRPLSAASRQMPPRPHLLEALHPGPRLPHQKAATTLQPTSKSKTIPRSGTSEAEAKAKVPSAPSPSPSPSPTTLPLWTLSEKLASKRGAALLLEEEAVEDLMAEFFEEPGDGDIDEGQVGVEQAGHLLRGISMYSEGSELELEA